MNEPVSLAVVAFSSFIIALSGAMMPGPMLAVTIREAAKRGFWAGPLVTVGHALLELALVLALIAGLGTIMQERLFLATVGLVGGASLIWMAVLMLRELPNLTISFDVDEDGGTHPVISGIVTTATNPYFVIWWATAGISALTFGGTKGWAAPTAFFTGHIAGDFAWYSLISALVHFGRKLLTDKRYRVLVGSMAVMLLLFGLLFMANGGYRLTSTS